MSTFFFSKKDQLEDTLLESLYTEAHQQMPHNCTLSELRKHLLSSDLHAKVSSSIYHFLVNTKAYSALDKKDQDELLNNLTNDILRQSALVELHSDSVQGSFFLPGFQYFARFITEHFPSAPLCMHRDSSFTLIQDKTIIGHGYIEHLIET